MIRKEDVRDLQPGDIVELAHARYPDVVIRGPLTADGGMLRCGFAIVRHSGGEVSMEPLTLTVVSRAPRPLYVNHPRTEPVPGDVVRIDDRDDWLTWSYRRDGAWYSTSTGLRCVLDPFAGLMVRLLVDGKTGQVVS